MQEKTNQVATVQVSVDSIIGVSNRNKYFRGELARLKVDTLDLIFTTERDTSLAVRLFWLVVLCMSACVCICLITKSVQEYTNYEVSTTIRVINEQKTDFPAITFCNENPFSTVYADKLFASTGYLSNKRTFRFFFLNRILNVLFAIDLKHFFVRMSLQEIRVKLF